MTDDEVPDPRGGPVAAVKWLLRTDNQGVVFVREAASSALVVAAIGFLLFAISGVWPPLVAIESGSMQPHMHRGDLVFIMDEDRFVSEGAVHGTGIVPHVVATDTGYQSFGDYGDVVVYAPPGRGGPPVIHRARFWVAAGENWYGRADPAYVEGYGGCLELPNCPAPHAGFITKGDANPYYDQVRGIAPPVKPAWIRGTAEFRIPWLGEVRLLVGTVEATGGAETPVANSTAAAGPPTSSHPADATPGQAPVTRPAA